MWFFHSSFQAFVHSVVKTTILLQYTSDVLIIRSIIVNGHYFCYQLLLKDVTDIVIHVHVSVVIMSFLVIIASLSAFMILLLKKCRFLLKESETRR